jgi:predicted Na+-dependent transporter
MAANAMLLLSIVLEAAVAIIAILAARKQRPHLYGLALTFAIYVLYDLARFLGWNVEHGVLSGLFLAATVSALVAVWGLYKERR